MPASWRAGRPKGSRRYDDEVFERILRRVERGEKLKDIRREPGQPGTAAFFWHRKAYPDFDRRWKEAMGRRVGAHVQAHEIEAVLMRVERGEGFVDVCKDPALPSSAAVCYYRRRHPADEPRWIAALGKRPGAKVERQPGRLDAFIEAVQAGQSSRSYNGLVDHRSIRRIVRTDTAFADRLLAAKQAARTQLVRRSAARTLTPNEVYALVEASLPSRLQPDVRDDVRADLVLGLLSGEIAPENAKAAARQAVTAHNRMFGRRDISFDAELGEGGFTFGGLITDGRAFDLEGTGHRVIEAAWA